MSREKIALLVHRQTFDGGTHSKHISFVCNTLRTGYLAKQNNLSLKYNAIVSYELLVYVMGYSMKEIKT